MNRKTIFFAGIIFVILLSAGVFTRIALPADSVPRLVSGCSSGSFSKDLFSYLRTDFLTVLAFFIFARSIILLPLNFLIAAAKTYALGFTAAHLMVSQSLFLCMAVLLPGSLVKIPVYGYLLLVSFDPSKPPKVYLKAFGIMAASSILEVLLIQVFL